MRWLLKRVAVGEGCCWRAWLLSGARLCPWKKSYILNSTPALFSRLVFTPCVASSRLVDMTSLPLRESFLLSPALPSSRPGAHISHLSYHHPSLSKVSTPPVLLVVLRL